MNSSHNGLWIPSFYYDLQVELSDKDAFKVRQVLNIIKSVVLCSLVGLPVIGVCLLVYGTYNLYFSEKAYNSRATSKRLLRSRASTIKLSPREDSLAEATKVCEETAVENV